jgi:hypothetical protein
VAHLKVLSQNTPMRTAENHEHLTKDSRPLGPKTIQKPSPPPEFEVGMLTTKPQRPSFLAVLTRACNWTTFLASEVQELTSSDN